MSDWQWDERIKEELRVDEVRTITRTVSIVIGAQELLKADGTRLKFYITNWGTSPCWIRPGPPVELDPLGILIEGGNGSVEVSLFEDGPVVTQQWSAFHDGSTIGGGVKLWIMEERRIS